MLSSPALNPATVTPKVGSGYPAQFAASTAQRQKRQLAEALGLQAFGVNLTTLPPGCVSALRHYHMREDEFIYIVSGELALVTDAGEQLLTVGMVAGFPGGVKDGHHLINRSQSDAVYLEVGNRDPACQSFYPDHDLTIGPEDADGQRHFTNLAGERYP